MQRLLVFHPALAPYRLDFFNALGRAFCCKVVFLQRSTDELLVAQTRLLRDATFDYTYLGAPLHIGGRALNRGFGREIRRFRPDVVLCCEFGQSVWAALAWQKLLRRPFRVFTMTDDSLPMAEGRSAAQRRRQNFLLRRVDGLVTISPEASLWYERNTPVRRTMHFPIIRNGQTAPEVRSARRQQAQAYVEKWGLAGCRVGLYVGRFIALKNLKALLDAFAFVAHEEGNADVRLVLVGGGEDEAALRRQVEDAGLGSRVVFAGVFEGEDLMAWYGVAGFLVLCSLREAFGAVVGEALQSGCRAMVSCYAGSRSLITAENGCVFDSRSADDFRQSLAQMYATSQPTPASAFERDSLLPVSFADKMGELKDFLSPLTD